MRMTEEKRRGPIDRKLSISVKLNGEDLNRLNHLEVETGISRSEIIRKLLRGARLEERKNIDLMLIRRDIDMMTGLLRASLSPVNLKGRASNEDIKRIEMLMTEIRDKVTGWEDL